MDFNTKDNLQTMCVNYCSEHLNFLLKMGAEKKDNRKWPWNLDHDPQEFLLKKFLEIKRREYKWTLNYGFLLLWSTVIGL